MRLDELVRAALAEDIGPGDATTEACVPADLEGRARIVARARLVVSGHDAAAEVFRQLGARYRAVVPAGEEAAPGAVVAEVDGPVRALLTGERTALNFLMRLSGIATHVRAVLSRLPGGPLRVVDTRKTTPLHRALERAAVRHGGGSNHRFALFDGVLVKDNHVAAAGGVAEAVRRARASVHHLLRVEVEADTPEQALEAARAGADAVLLDNMDDDTMARLVPELRRLRPGIVVEASGGIGPERLARLQEIGLDVVSMGGLVHQARWVDLSMELEAAS